jgi:anti-anti-sigma regulatory factor
LSVSPYFAALNPGAELVVLVPRPAVTRTFDVSGISLYQPGSDVK